MEDDIIDGKTYKPWQFKPGNPGGPGRPPGKTLKEYSREYLAAMTEQERHDFLAGLDKIDIWKMAEGNPHSTDDSKVTVVLPAPLLSNLHGNNNSDTKDRQTEEKN